MHEAARQLGGELLIASSLGKGTLLTLTTITEK
jgi:nitrate/nitrite-specific signal transduction histidine kinase